MIEQHRRNPGKPAMFYREDHVPFNAGERQLLETDVLGRDGHVYKGRIQSPVLPFIDTSVCIFLLLFVKENLQQKGLPGNGQAKCFHILPGFLGVFRAHSA